MRELGLQVHVEEVEAGRPNVIGVLEGASSGLLSREDAGEAAALMQPNSLGLMIVYENLWSIPFAVAAREAGGQLVAHGHIPTQAVVDALDALEA